MRLAWLGLASLLAMPVAAQEEPEKKKPAAKKQVASKKIPKAHQKPTPEQIRKFNDLQQNR